MDESNSCNYNAMYSSRKKDCSEKDYFVIGTKTLQVKHKNIDENLQSLEDTAIITFLIMTGEFPIGSILETGPFSLG